MKGYREKWLAVAGWCYRGEHGAETASVGGRCEGNAERTNSFEGERGWIG